MIRSVIHPPRRLAGKALAAAGMMLAFLTQPMQAQTPAGSPMQLSLQEAVDYALEHNRTIQNARYDAYIADKQVKDYLAIGLPQVNGQLQALDNQIVPTTALPGQFFDPNAPEGTFVPVKFGVRFQGSASVSLSQLLFDGSFFVGLQATRGLQELSEINVQRSEVEAAAAVTSAYYTALVSQERASILDVNLERLRKLLETTQALYEQGFAEKIDVDRIRINHDNLFVEREKALRMVEMGRDLLKFQMGLDIQTEVSLTDTLDASQPVEKPILEPSDGFAANRVEYQQLLKAEELQALNLKRWKVGYLPSAVAFANYGLNTFGEKWDFLANDWYDQLTIGIRINVPIFDGFQKQAKIQMTQLEMQKLANNRLMFEESVSLQVQNAQTQLLNSWNSLQTNRSTLELAREVLEVATVKFTEGVGSNLEVIDAESTLRSSQTNYLSALYDYMLAKVEYDRVTGNLLK